MWLAVLKSPRHGPRLHWFTTKNRTACEPHYRLTEAMDPQPDDLGSVKICTGGCLYFAQRIRPRVIDRARYNAVVREKDW